MIQFDLLEIQYCYLCFVRHCYSGKVFLNLLTNHFNSIVMCNSYLRQSDYRLCHIQQHMFLICFHLSFWSLSILPLCYWIQVLKRCEPFALLASILHIFCCCWYLFQPQRSQPTTSFVCTETQCPVIIWRLYGSLHFWAANKDVFIVYCCRAVFQCLMEKKNINK